MAIEVPLNHPRPEQPVDPWESEYIKYRVMAIMLSLSMIGSCLATAGVAKAAELHASYVKAPNHPCQVPQRPINNYRPPERWDKQRLDDAIKWFRKDTPSYQQTIY